MREIPFDERECPGDKVGETAQRFGGCGKLFHRRLASQQEAGLDANLEGIVMTTVEKIP